MMKKMAIGFSVLGLVLSSCGKPVKRGDSAKDVAKTVVEALKAEDVELLIPYYLTEKEAKGFADDFVEEEEDASDIFYRFDYDSDAIYDIDIDAENLRKKKDKGFSDSKIERYFTDDNARFRKDFKSVLSDGKSNDIKWSKVKFDRIELPNDSKRKRGSKPTWIKIWMKEGQKSFFIAMYNAVETEKGWTCGLSMKFGTVDDLSEASDYDVDYDYQQMLADSVRMADSMYAADQAAAAASGNGP